MAKKKVETTDIVEDEVREIPIGEDGELDEDAIGVPKEGAAEGFEGAIPPTMVIPPHAEVVFMRFPTKMTKRPDLGDRVLVLWQITTKEERFAYKRAQGDQLVAVDELAKSAIRAIDGKAVDWSRGGFEVNKLWDELPMACILLLRNWYARTHTLTKEQQMDFFVNHFSVRTAVVG